MELCISLESGERDLSSCKIVNLYSHLRGVIDRSFLFYLQNYLCHKNQGVLCPFQPMRAADEPKIDHVTHTLKLFTVYQRILK